MIHLTQSVVKRISKIGNREVWLFKADTNTVITSNSIFTAHPIFAWWWFEFLIFKLMKNQTKTVLFVHYQINTKKRSNKGYSICQSIRPVHSSTSTHVWDSILKPWLQSQMNPACVSMHFSCSPRQLCFYKVKLFLWDK